MSVFIQPVQQNTATRPPNVELKLEKGHRQRWKQRKHSSHSTKVSPPPTHVVLLPWCGSVCAGLVGSFAPSCFSLSGPQLPVTKKTRRARRARIEARTATLRDHKAEIAAQERELAAAVKEKSEVDDEIETAKAEIATREAKHPSVIMVELKDELARLATSIQLETDKQTVYLNQTQMSTTHIAAMRADIETLKSQRQALEQQMGK